MSASSRLLAILVAALLVAGAFLFTRWQQAREALVAAEARAEARHATIAELRASMDLTDRVVSGWAKDRTTLADVRSATRAAVKEAFRDASFKAWADAPVHPDAWRLLREAGAGADLAPAPVRPDGAGGGTGHPGPGN